MTQKPTGNLSGAQAIPSHNAHSHAIVGAGLPTIDSIQVRRAFSGAIQQGAVQSRSSRSLTGTRSPRNLITHLRHARLIGGGNTSDYQNEHGPVRGKSTASGPELDSALGSRRSASGAAACLWIAENPGVSIASVFRSYCPFLNGRRV